MTRPSAKNRETIGNATSEAEAPVTLAQTADAAAPVDAASPEPFPAASQDDGKVPAPLAPEPTVPAREKTAAELQAEARVERMLADAELREAQRNIELAELRAEMDEMRKLLGRAAPAPHETIRLRATSVNQEVFEKNWKLRAGNADKEAPILGKTFKVIPQGPSLKNGMPVAIVENASDAADAKAHYAMKLLGDKAGNVVADVQLLPDSTAA